MLSKWELTRYSRNILLPEVGRKGQERLKESKVGVVGAGGLGSPVLYYLAAAGVGKIRLIDSDIIDLTNLQRQILYNTEQVGSSKAASAKEVLSRQNPMIQIEAVGGRLNATNAEEILSGLDLILEGSDNFPTKFLVNDFCVLNGIPFLIGGILGFEGQIFGGSPGNSPCYRCIFREPPPPDSVPTCSEAGVIGSVAGVIGSTMATQAIHHLLKIGEPIGEFFLSFDLKDLSFRKIPVKRNPRCPVCGENPRIQSLDPKNYSDPNDC